MSDHDNNSYIKIIENASKYEYVKTNEQINYADVSIKIISYKSTKDDHHICYINIKNEDNQTYEMFGLVDDSKNKYIFIGLNMYHSFMRTNEFEYYQSDGSTNFYISCFCDDNEYSVSTVFTIMTKYFM